MHRQFRARGGYDGHVIYCEEVEFAVELLCDLDCSFQGTS